MWRNAFSIVAAFIAAFVIMMLLQYANALLFPPPAGLDYNKPDDLVKIMAQMPLQALLGVELSYVLGSLVAGAMVGWLASSHARRLAIALGVFLTLMNIMNLVQVPHPAWLGVLTTATFLPFTWLGTRWTANRRSSAQ